MKCFVTGATGFVGANLAHVLAAGGHQVKVLLRTPANAGVLKGVAHEVVQGDLLDTQLLERELKDCDWCFHVAASYHLWMRDYAPMYESNVTGTRNVLKAAGKAGCKRIVYTSTVGCIGLQPSGPGPRRPATEDDAMAPGQLSNHYKKSKYQAECAALELWRQDQLPIVIVNPSAPVGPMDAKPTPTGRVIVDFLNLKMPAYLDTGLNWVHVRDVAAGHVLAAQKGRLGERYILGNAEGNWTMKETLGMLRELSGRPSPSFKIPYWLALAAAAGNEAFSSMTGIPPRAPLAGVRMARYTMWFDPGKAIRELGLPQTPPKAAFADAIQWFIQNGYVKNAGLSGTREAA